MSWTISGMFGDKLFTLTLYTVHCNTLHNNIWEPSLHKLKDVKSLLPEGFKDSFKAWNHEPEQSVAGGQFPLTSQLVSWQQKWCRYDRQLTENGAW